MLVDTNIHSFFKGKYGENTTIKRIGIEEEDGSTSVELYLKRFNLYPIPMKKTFKFHNLFKNKLNVDEGDLPAVPVYISKTANVTELEKKI